MLALKSILVLSAVIVFILTIAEYVLLQKMVPFYYCNGPFGTTETFKSLDGKNAVTDRLQREKAAKLTVRSSNNCVLARYKPSLILWFFWGEFRTQRIVLTFLDEAPNCDVRCDIRPFYSAFVLPAVIALFIIFDVIVPNQYAGIPMKIFGSAVACGIGLALFMPFRPRKDTISRIKTDVKSAEESPEDKPD
ncbi:MAG: hypothetical protein ACYSU4_18635 [Planctomycetota bacterium]|jgi:hypothetical protein